MSHHPRRSAITHVRAAMLVLVIAALAVTATATEAPAASRSITITDSTGHTERLDRPATRVVALEWVHAEDLATLGVEPVGVADKGGYAFWVAQPTLSKRTVDVGTRQQPSLERIAALRPDLIVGVEHRLEGSRRQLDRIAPTLLFNPYPRSGDRLDEMRTTFSAIAKATGREARAASVLAELDAKFTAATTTLATAGLAAAPVALAQAGTSEGQVGARMFTSNSMAVEILTAIGLRNGWPGPNETYGFNLADLESFTLMAADVSFVYVPQSAKDDIVRGQFAGNPVWDGLGFVRAGHVSRLPPDTWLYGGPRSAEVFVDRLLERLVQ
ncbi:MAG: iron-siderophore ABC transporter substrate-binding protein [Acidimicrobiia bacterium]